ncbi:LysR family transcriptional regulator, partial [Catenulispora sp. NF23]
MELRQLEQFVAVAEERHFTRAAARVHVGQSGLSAAIAALEHELGDALFVRDNRQVTLTAAGQALLPAARRALAAVQDGRDAVAGVRGVLHGRLHVGAIQTFGVVDLPAALAGFRRRHPAVTVRLTHDAAGALARAVAEAELDIAFVDGPVDSRLTRVRLGRDRLVLAVPAGDPLADAAEIGLADPALADHDFVAYRLDSGMEAQIAVACADSGLARRIVAEVVNLQYLVEFVRHGAGAAILPPGAIPAGSPGIRAIPITPPIHRDLCAVVPGRRPPTGLARALLDALLET